jgi:hypothetical protein
MHVCEETNLLERGLNAGFRSEEILDGKEDYDVVSFWERRMKTSALADPLAFCPLHRIVPVPHNAFKGQ